ncbi:hypothetical protein [Jatrophihabitans fulvus]
MTEQLPDDDFPALEWDAETLRERFVDPDAAQAHVEVLRERIRGAQYRADEIGELLARGELVDLLRIRGELDDALAEANAAVDRAELEGTPPQVHLARVRLAHVHSWRGEYGDANVVLTELMAAAGRLGPVVEAYTRHHAGLNDYEQGHWSDARQQFTAALKLREQLELDEAELAPLRTALAAAERHAEEQQ